jgi:hypothetical protein
LIDGTVTVFSDAPAARAETIDKGLRLTLDRPRGTVRFFLVFRDSLDARKPDVAFVRAAGWDGLLRAHTDAWRAFWGDTYISIPDARIQEIYYTALYNLKCWSTAWSIPVGILGVGEPLMYAVTLPLGRPFVCACLGSGVGGVLAWLFHLGTVSQGVSGLFGLLIVVPGTQVQYVIAMLAAYVGGFVLTYFFGVDEARIDDVFGVDG